MNGLALTILIGQLPKLLRVLGRREWADRRDPRVRRRYRIGRGGCGRCSGRTRQPRADPGHPELAASDTRRPGRGGGRDRRRGAFNLGDHGVALVGTLPAGLPRSPGRARSPICRSWWQERLASRSSRSTDTISTASAFASRKGQEVDGNREMIGIGAANVGAGALPGLPGEHQGSRPPSPSRPARRRNSPGWSARQPSSLMLVLVPGLLRSLPESTLAAVVIAASLSLADISGVRRLWHQRRAEFLLSMTAFLGVALLGVLPGIAVAVALSILNVFRRAWLPYRDHPRSRLRHVGAPRPALYPDAEQLPGLVILRFDAPLFFANARTFRDEVRRLGCRAAAALDRVRGRADHDVDTTAADMLPNSTRSSTPRASRWCSPSSRTR